MAQANNDQIGANVVALEGVKIGWTNFQGLEGPFNKKDERFFTVFLPEAVAEELSKLGWNVKFPEAEEIPEEGFEKNPTIQIKMKIDGARPPKIAIVNGRNNEPVMLNGDSVGILDNTDIDFVDIEFRANNYDVQGRQGKSAWLRALYVTINKYAFDDKYGV